MTNATTQILTKMTKCQIVVISYSVILVTYVTEVSYTQCTKENIFFYKSHIRWSYKNAKDITRKPNSHSTGCQYIVGQHPFFSSGKNLTSSVNLKIYISSAYHQFLIQNWKTTLQIHHAKRTTAEAIPCFLYTERTEDRLHYLLICLNMTQRVIRICSRNDS